MSCFPGCGGAEVTPSRAHCGTCHVTFAGVGLFDRHWRGGLCVPPEKMGLIRKGSFWGTEMSAEARNRFAGTSGVGSDV